MATLILTAVGTAVGGPVGGAIGALVGQAVDARIFAPKERAGPRLGDLSVQTSSYGTQIPKLFGTMRVAGTVIWATDLRETRSKSGGGKGKPSTTNFTYSASFAVALSGRRITSVGRIWAEGKLLRGAGGDFKSRTGFRLYLGLEGQPVDPLIAAAEGIGQAPAFRGIAYALFEDFQLEDFGNRIPSLTFEVEADAEPVAIGAIAAELSDDAVVDGGTLALGGYAASGDSVRGAVEALSLVVPVSLADVGGVLVIKSEASEPIEIDPAEAGARGQAGGGGRTEIVRRAGASVADEVSVAYHDVARDFQTGLQRATLGGGALWGERLALPAALDAAAAKAIAERRLAWLRAGRATAKLHLPWRHSSVPPGAYVRIGGQAGLWKVERWTLDHMVTSLELVRAPGGTPVASGASPGRAVAQPDLAHGATILFLFDLPPLTDALATGPRLAAVAAGGEGWRRAALSVSYDAGTSWEDIGATAGAAVIGHAVSALGPAGSALIDAAGSVEVELFNDAMWLEGRNDDALVGGANLAMLGDELIQFGAAEPLGDRRFRLSRLLRGRRGSEWAAALHEPGEPFALIEAETMAVIEPPAAMLGGVAMMMANGIGDDMPATATRPIVGNAARPPSPVHLRASKGTDGGILIEWARRSRSGWAWLSGSDTPLGEESEIYRLTIAGSAFERVVVTAAPAWLYSAAEQAADGAAGTITISVTQAGSVARSRASAITVEI